MNNIIDFYDIYDYYTVPIWQTIWFKIGIALAIISIVGLVVFLILRTKKKLLPWELALQQLEKLSGMPLEQKSDFKKFYFELTAIIKNYLSKRYQWRIHDKTDEELIAWLNEQNFDPEIITMLQTISTGALSIKFANQDALKSQAEADIKNVHLIIEKTKEQPQKL